MIDDRRRLELELLLQQSIPGNLGRADAPSLLQKLKTMGFDPARHAALGEQLTALLDQQSSPHPDSASVQANPAPTHATNATAPIERSTDPSAEETTLAVDTVAETATSYLQEFSVEGVLEQDPEEAAAESAGPEDLESSLNDADRSPVINLVDRILMQALQLGASDIHVEPQHAGLQLRFRQDGVLQSHIEPLPSRLIPAVTSRFKIMADLDIAERRIAQDGRIRRRFQNRTVDFRVNSLPSRYGEKIVLRLLDSSATQLGLDKLISNPEALELVRTLGSKPFGMILVTGPTGSGKSTTL